MGMTSIRCCRALGILAPLVILSSACGGAPETETVDNVDGSSSASTGGGPSETFPPPLQPEQTSIQLTGGGGSGGAAVGGGGGGGITGSESCPGQVVVLNQGDTVVLSGSTTGATHNYDTFCGPGSAPDLVYQLQLPSDCSLSIDATGVPGFDPIVSVRFTQCDARVTEDLCSPGPAIVQHQPAGTFWLVVDGADGQSGDYTVNVSCGAPTCGDLVVNAGEQCDLGQGITGDTCSDACTAEGATAADTCLDVGAPFPVPVGATVLPQADPWFTNADASHDAIGSCAYQGEVDGKDEIFAFVPDASGTLTIATALDLAGNPVCSTFLEPECWFSFLFVREADCASGTEVACSGIDLNTGVNQISLPVTAGQIYYLFVDGLNGEYYSHGPYTLHFNLVP